LVAAMPPDSRFSPVMQRTRPSPPSPPPSSGRPRQLGAPVHTEQSTRLDERAETKKKKTKKKGAGEKKKREFATTTIVFAAFVLGG